MPNRLLNESSPYLLQHAHNPVDWHPYGEEAFAEARREDKPILLSIGYSTCHWCHVMAHDSFEHPEAAALLNAAFVCVKLDREERPDVDRLYMHVCQMLNHSGGWPLNVLLLPDGRPFFAATFIPRLSAFGRSGLMDFVPQVQKMWKEERRKIISTAQAICAELEALAFGATPGEPPSEETLLAAQQALSSRFDGEFGGFLPAPKFPMPQQLDFLLRRWRKGAGDSCLLMAERSLLAMCRGGILDQIGFGLHRYSTDAQWLLPHFEKMLSDQALFCLCLADGLRAGGNFELQAAGLGCLNYVAGSLASPEGDFYTAQDADSEGREGKFYVWKLKEILEVLGPEDGPVYAKAFGIIEPGNFREEASGDQTGENVVHRALDTGSLARELELDPLTLGPRLEEMRQKLLARREKRVHPAVDTKIITDLNGLMIAAFSRCALAFDNPALAKRAELAASALLARQRDGESRLWRCRGGGGGSVAAMLSDYACLIFGLCELYLALGHAKWLGLAKRLAEEMIAVFKDPADAAYYMSAPGGPGLALRQKESTDGALPPGNAVAAQVLATLFRLCGDVRFDAEAMSILRAFGGDIASQPSAHLGLICVADALLEPPQAVVLCAPADSPQAREMLRGLGRLYRPNLVWHFLTDERRAELCALAPYLSELPSPDGRLKAYVRRGRKWLEPAHTAEELLLRLGS